MNTAERKKAIETAVAAAVGNAWLPTAIKVGLAAMGEELRELRAEIEKLKGASNGK